MNVVLNTDNRLMSGTTLTDEYMHAAKHARIHVRRAVRDRDERVRQRVPSMGGSRATHRSRARRHRRAERRRVQHDDRLARRDARTRRRRDSRSGSAAQRPTSRSCSAPGSADSPTRSTLIATIPFREIPGFPVGDGRRPRRRDDRRDARAGNSSSRSRDGFTCTRATTSASPRFPRACVHALGAKTLIVSNAAGGVNRLWQPGDLMLIRDHINLMFRNPLIGAVEPGDMRFPDMSEPYDAELATTRARRRGGAGDLAARRRVRRARSVRRTRRPPK